MKPYVLVLLMLLGIFGETIWMYLAIQDDNQLEALILFVVGTILGFVNGRWTSKMFEVHYIESLQKRLNIINTPIGRKNMIFTFSALGIPMIASFIPEYHNHFLPIMQSYIFGFICGMNISIYSWVRQLPD